MEISLKTYNICNCHHLFLKHEILVTLYLCACSDSIQYDIKNVVEYILSGI